MVCTNCKIRRGWELPSSLWRNASRNELHHLCCPLFRLWRYSRKIGLDKIRGLENVSGYNFIPTQRYRFYLNFYSKRDLSNARLATAEWIKCHPRFSQQKRGIYNDICLIKLKKSLPCDSKTRPACLPTKTPSEKKVGGLSDLFRLTLIRYVMRLASVI